MPISEPPIETVPLDVGIHTIPATQLPRRPLPGAVALRRLRRSSASPHRCTPGTHTRG